MNELYHHGIKGMKWGVRRYQNPDGSLTSEGYLHYGYGRKEKIGLKKKKTYYRMSDKGLNYAIKNNKLTDIGNRMIKNTTLVDDEPEFSDGKTREQLKKEAGIKKENNYETIKKGAKVYRLTNSDETIDNKRKYVYTTEDDQRQYDSMFEFFDAGNLNKDTYSLKKDIKIAPIEKTMQFVLNEVKDTKVRDYIDDKKDNEVTKIMKKIQNRTIESVFKEYDANYKNKSINLGDRYDKQISKQIESDFTSNYISALHASVSGALSKIDDKTMDDKLVKHFSKLGYDAIVDPNDGYEFATYPLIVLNPKDSMKRESHKYYF
jgi:hypothetical protein